MFTSKYFNLGKVVCTVTLNNTMAEKKITICFPSER